jgi:hypothetical protein
MWDKRIVRGNTYSSIVSQKVESSVVKAVKRRPAVEVQEVVEVEE